tara:strand:+ start:734 stop:883 length:150 start_codon:yes stop_codon:yes gene_type:complete
MSESNYSIDAQEWVVQFDGQIKHTITNFSNESDSVDGNRDTENVNETIT